MSTASERVQVFQDTQNWIKSDPVLSASVCCQFCYGPDLLGNRQADCGV